MRFYFLYTCLLFQFASIAQKQAPFPPQIDKSLQNLIIDFGKTYKGTPYKYGSHDSKIGFDCSGFIYYIFKMGGIKLPRTSREIYTIGDKTNFEQLKKGDLLFFNTLSNNRISHVGIVSEIDDKKIIMLHVSSSKGVQEINLLESDYWYARFAGAKTL